MLKRILVPTLVVACVLFINVASAAKDEGRQEFKVGSGGLLEIDLETGGGIEIRGTGGSSIIVEYSKRCDPECEILFEETSRGLKISSEFVGRGRNQSSSIEFNIQVPSVYDLELESMGGDVLLSSNSGSIELCVPSRFGMQLELQVAFTRNSSKKFEIEAPRKFLRQSGTINGDITVREGC